MVEDEMAAVVEAPDAYGPKPTWRGRLHQIAFFVTLPAGFFLLAAAETTAARVAVAVYWATLAGQFGASASYHRLAHTERAVKWLRRLDHSMIFCLIAGTYTPICLLVLPRAWGIPMLVAAWVTALAGVIMKMISLRCVESSVPRNAFPSTGISPRNGTCRRVVCVCSRKSPPRTIV